MKAYIDVNGQRRRQLIKPATIEIIRAEGPCDLCDIKQAATGWIEANSILRANSSTAPKGGAYDKHDFKVTFEDGETYDGRYDLHHWEYEQPSLDGHVQGYLRYLSGEAPGWMDDAQRRRFKEDRARNPEQVAEAKRWLETYDLGQLPPVLADDETAEIIHDYRKV